MVKAENFIKIKGLRGVSDSGVSDTEVRNFFGRYGLISGIISVYCFCWCCNYFINICRGEDGQ